jgi:gliding motility-associated-like protein
MEAGKSYALIINNFSNTGSGFQLTFGGTGTFQGPQVDFTAAPTPVCTGDGISFTDASTAVEGISELNWNFGVGASPATATGPGPHSVSYSTAGTRSVVLTVTSESGCVVTDIRQVEVLPAPSVSTTTLADYCGPDELTGAVFLSPTGTAPVPYLYDWANSGLFGPDSSRTSLASGTYEVAVLAANGCQKTFSFTIEEGLALAAGQDPVHPPTCHGGSDGSISISIDIANEPVLFDFGNGPQPDSVLSGIPAGTYAVQVVDDAGCEGNFVIQVLDFPPLAAEVQSVNISCFGNQDGMVAALPEGGAGGYAYQWAHGPTAGSLSGLPAGTYSVTVTDANGCTAVAGAAVAEPAPLFLSFTTEDVRCHGDASGVIRLTAQGGTPPYQYSADGISFQSEPVLTGLPAGAYTVVVQDAAGCQAEQPALIQEPAPFVVEAGADQTVDLGYQVDLQAIILPPFSAVTLNWTPANSLSCTECLDPVASPLSTTTYLLTAVDANGCVSEDSVVVTVLLKRPVFIPNAFTPNADGLNDFFTVYAGPAARIVRSLKVFSRWGSLVYEGYDLPLNQDGGGWDGLFRGSVMDPGVFAYVAEVEFIDGVVELHEGDVMILR